MLAILVAVSLYFNPRTPRGVRRGLCAVCPSVGAISIHAPARGATAMLEDDPVLLALYFNPRTREGCDSKLTKEQRVCLAQFAYLHKGKKAEHTKNKRAYAP